MKKILIILLFLYFLRIYDVTVVKGDDENNEENNIIIPIPTIQLTPPPITSDIVNIPLDIITTPTPNITETPAIIPAITDEPTITDIPTITDTPTITETPTVTDTPTLTITPSVTPSDTITPPITDSSKDSSPVLANQNDTGGPTSTPMLEPTKAPTMTPTPTSTPSPLSKPIITKISKIIPFSFLTKNLIYQDLYKSKSLSPQTTKLLLLLSLILTILGAVLIWFDNLYKVIKERILKVNTKIIRGNFLKISNEK